MTPPHLNFPCYETTLAFLSSQGILSINSSLASEESYASPDVNVKQTMKEWGSSTGHGAWRHILFSVFRQTELHHTPHLCFKKHFNAFPVQGRKKSNNFFLRRLRAKIKFWVFKSRKIMQDSSNKYQETAPPLASHLLNYPTGNTTTKPNNLPFPPCWIRPIRRKTRSLLLLSCKKLDFGGEENPDTAQMLPQIRSDPNSWSLAYSMTPAWLCPGNAAFDRGGTLSRGADRASSGVKQSFLLENSWILTVKVIF